jgi:hypothetical protein
MAQIIKHRRGNLEGLSSATTRAGELLVVTGSSGLGTIANGDSLVFVGIDGSTATPVNKILQGTTVPNLSGADYNTHVDGIPFYDTDDNKLYILNKGGNIEVKASPETGGTGLVSGSSQLANSSVSNESLNAYTASNNTTNSGQDTRLDQLSTFTGSISGDFVDNSELAAATGALETSDSALSQRAGRLENYTSSFAASTVTLTNKTINGPDNTITNIANSSLANSAITISGTSVSLGGAITDEVLFGGVGVVTGSAQVVSLLSNQATDFGSGRISGASIGDVAGTSTITGSFVGDGSGLTGLATNLTVDGDSGTQNVDLINDDLQFLGTANEIATAVTKVGNDVKVTLSLPDDVTIGNDLTVVGNLEVQGTTTSVDSTTVVLGDNILALNGSGAALGGLEVHDANGPASGSLLWNGTTNQWIAGASGSESKVLVANGDGVFSGSAQVSGITNSQLAGSISNDKLAGSIANDKLANSAITISGTSVSLGGAITDEVLFGGVGVVTGSAQVVLQSADKTGFTGASSITTLGTIATGVWNGTAIDKANLDDEVLNASLNAYTASNNTTNSGQDSRLDQLSAFTSSVSGDFVDQAELAAATGALETADTALQQRAGRLENYTSSFAASTVTLTNKTIDASSNTISNIANSSLTNDGITIAGVDTSLGGTITYETIAGGSGTISGSAQVVSSLSNQATDFGSGRISGDDFGDVGGTTDFTGSFIGDGSALTGVASTLDISGSSGNGSVALKTQDLTFAGTANEIETSVSGQTVTIGIPTNPTLSGNVTVTGNLSVEGTTTTIDSTTVNIGDRIIELNYADGAGDAGLLVSDVTGDGTTSGSLLWDASEDHWMAGALGSEKEIARLNATPTSNTVLKADSNGLLVDSLITDDGTNVTVSGTAELRINAATANSFVYFDSNKSLESVAAATAGDVIQWNGSSFVASNELDGGTF